MEDRTLDDNNISGPNPTPTDQPQLQPDHSNQQNVPPAPPIIQTICPIAQPPKKRRIARFIFVSLLGLSIVVNIYLLLIVAATMSGDFDNIVHRKGTDGSVVAIYELTGVIDAKAARDFDAFCREVKDEFSGVEAVVIRVESPGGGISASDQIHAAIVDLKRTYAGKRTIPVVVSMGSMAASGGYYISVPADHIFAEPTTITGSIGVIMAWPVLKGTFEKIGLEPVVLRSSNARGWKDEISQMRKPGPRHRQHLIGILDKFQERFERLVTAGRGNKLKTRSQTYKLTEGEGDNAKTIDHTETEPFNGKVYLTDEAIALGMIDEKGYLGDAVAHAIEIAKLRDPTVQTYRRKAGFMSKFMGQASSKTAAFDVPKILDDLQSPRIEVRWRPE